MAIYGGSIGQVSQNEMVLGAQQRAAMERQLMMLLEHHNRQQQNSMQERQMSRQDANDMEQRRQFDASLSARNAEANALRTERAREFDLNKEIRQDDLRERQRTRRQAILQNSRVRNEVAADREARMILPQVEAAADEGAWGSLEEFQATNPPAVFPYANSLVARSLRARKILGDQHAAMQADAELLNTGPSRVASLRHMVTQEGNDSWNPDRNRMFLPDRPDEDAIGQWNAEAAAIESARTGVLGDKNRMGQLMPDASGRYAPVGTLPWMNRVPARTAPPKADGPTAINPKTGQRIVFRDGKWQPL